MSHRRPSVHLNDLFPREIDIEVCLKTLKIYQKLEGDVNCVVWDASLVLAKYLETMCHHKSDFLSGLKVLELGSGLGVVGLTAATLGAQVTLTDLPEALPLLRLNIRENKSKISSMGGYAIAESLVWGDSTSEILQEEYDLIVMADCIYYEEAIENLLETLSHLNKSLRKKPIIYLTQEMRDSDVQKNLWNTFYDKLSLRQWYLKWHLVVVVGILGHEGLRRRICDEVTWQAAAVGWARMVRRQVANVRERVMFCTIEHPDRQPPDEVVQAFEPKGCKWVVENMEENGNLDREAKSSPTQRIKAVGDSWIKCKSRKYSHIYYFNTLTGKSVWNLSKPELDKAQCCLKQNFEEVCPEPSEPPSDVAQPGPFHMPANPCVHTQQPIMNNQFPNNAYPFNNLCNSFASLNPTVSMPAIPQQMGVPYNPNAWSVPPYPMYMPPTALYDSVHAANSDRSKTGTKEMNLNNRFGLVMGMKDTDDNESEGKLEKSHLNSIMERDNRYEHGATKKKLPVDDLRKKLIAKRKYKNSQQQNGTPNKYLNSAHTVEKKISERSEEIEDQMQHLNVTANKMMGANKHEDTPLTKKSVSFKRNLRETITFQHENNSAPSRLGHGRVKKAVPLAKDETENSDDIPSDDEEDDELWLSKNTRVHDSQQLLEVSCLKKMSGCGDSEFWYIAADANVFFCNLPFLKILIHSDDRCRLLVSELVYKEMQSSAKSSSDKQSEIRARYACRFITELLSNGKAVTDRALLINHPELNCPIGDDHILNTCVRLADVKYHLILLSNDKLLERKSIASRVHTFTVKQIKNFLSPNNLKRKSNKHPENSVILSASRNDVSNKNSQQKKHEFSYQKADLKKLCRIVSFNTQTANTMVVNAETQTELDNTSRTPPPVNHNQVNNRQISEPGKRCIHTITEQPETSKITQNGNTTWGFSNATQTSGVTQCVQPWDIPSCSYTTQATNIRPVSAERCAQTITEQPETSKITQNGNTTWGISNATQTSGVTQCVQPWDIPSCSYTTQATNSRLTSQPHKSLKQPVSAERCVQTITEQPETSKITQNGDTTWGISNATQASGVTKSVQPWDIPSCSYTTQATNSRLTSQPDKSLKQPVSAKICVQTRSEHPEISKINQNEKTTWGGFSNATQTSGVTKSVQPWELPSCSNTTQATKSSEIHKDLIRSTKEKMPIKFNQTSNTSQNIQTSKSAKYDQAIIITRNQTSGSVKKNIPNSEFVKPVQETNFDITNKLPELTKTTNMVQQNTNLKTSQLSNTKAYQIMNYAKKGLVNTGPRKREIRLKRTSILPTKSPKVNENDKVPFKWRKKKAIGNSTTETNISSVNSDDIQNKSLNATVNATFMNALNSREEIQPEFSESSDSESTGNQNITQNQSMKSPRIVEESPTTDSVISNTRSSVYSDTLRTLKQVSANLMLENSKNEEVVKTGDLFEVTDPSMEESLRTGCEEWVSRFVQIMEEVLTQILQRSDTSIQSSMPPPWTMHEATQCIVKTFSNQREIQEAANLFSVTLCEISDKRGNLRDNLKPKEFMEMFAYGVNLVHSIQKVLRDCEDIRTAIQLLSKLLDDIRDPKYFDNTTSLTENAMDILNEDVYNEDTSLLQNQEDASQTEGEQINSNEIDTRKNTNNPIQQSVKINRNFDNIGHDYDSLKRALERKKEIDNCHAVAPEDTNESSSGKLVKTVVNLDKTDVNPSEPKITRKFSIFPEFEERINKNISLDLDALDYSDEGSMDSEDEHDLEEDNEYFEDDTDLPDNENNVDNDDIYIPIVIEKFITLVKDSFQEILMFCQQIRSEIIRKNKLSEARKIEMQDQANHAHAYISELLSETLNRILDRETNEPETTNDGLTKEYRKIIEKYSGKAKELLAALDYISNILLPKVQVE